MAAPNVIQLRRLLTEKFPGLRVRAGDFAVPQRPLWPSGLAALDAPLQGGFPRGALTEIVAEERGAGSALLSKLLLRKAARENQLAGLVDGRDSFDVTQVESEILSRLLWVRCRSAEEALNAADLLLRDGNLPVVLVDLAANPLKQLRKIPSSSWYRFQRIMEHTSNVCLVLTAKRIVSAAQVRLTLSARLSLESLDLENEELASQMKVDVFQSRRTSSGEDLAEASA